MHQLAIDGRLSKLLRTLSRPGPALALSLGMLTLIWLPILVVMAGRGSWDDWWFRATYAGLRTYGAITAADPFRFSDGSAAAFRDSIENGFGVWFAHPEVRVALWRPLTAASHYFDHLVWGFNSGWAYLHSFGWLVLLVVGAARLFRLCLRPGQAALATFVFAVAASHAEPVTWMAARNSLVAAALGTWALALHVGVRESGGRSSFAAALLFGLGLLGGEAGLGALLFVGAYEAWARPLRLRSAAVALAPWLGVCAAWFVAYALQGYGTANSGYYINPLHEPVRFAANLPGRWLTLEGGAFTTAPMALWLFRPESRPGLVAAGMAALVLVGAGLLFLRRKPSDCRAAAWFALAGTLSCLPQLGGFPCARSLLFPSVGAAGFFGVLLVEAAARWQSLRLYQRAVFALLALVHLVLAPLGWLSALRVHGGAVLAEEAVVARSELSGLNGQRVILLTSPDPVMAGYLGVRAALERGARFRSWLVLSHAQVGHRLERTAPNEFVLIQESAPPPYFEDVFRDPEHASELGRYTFSYFSSEPEAVEGTWRKRVRFRFAKDLDDPSLVFLAWSNGAVRRVHLPAVGRSLALPFEKGPWNLL